LKPMPIQIDIRKAPFYRWGREEEFKEGKREGLKEGLVKGLKEAILRIAQVKFSNSKAKQIKNFLEKVDDIKYLKKIETEAIKAKSWEDLIKAFKNSNSKSKNSKKGK
jgi:flagellar biosynthesis/type III secretory pathway protein FliH